VNRLGVRTEWDYDSNGRVTELREAAGLPEQRTTRYAYPDALTRVKTQVGDEYTPDAVTTNVQDQYGNLARHTDAEGNTTEYSYNAQGKTLTETRPSGAVYSYEYDPQGNLTKKTDPLDRATRYEYDKAGNLQTMTWPNQAVTTYGYNVLNRRASVTDALNHTTETVYDRATRSFTLKDPRDAETEMRLNAQGFPALKEDPNGNVTRQTYDDGRLAATQYPTFEQSYEYAVGSRLKRITDHYDGQQAVTQIQLDPYGQLKKRVDAKQNPEYRDYDGLGRLIRIIDAIGGVTRLTYDTHGNLVKVTDPEDRSTWFEYNGNGQVVAEERRPAPGEVNRRTYEYNADGDLHIEITPNGEKVDYDYNPAGELTKLTFYPDQNTSTPEQVTEFKYNDLGLLESYDEGETSGSYNYDKLGQLLTSTIDYGPFSKTISYTYDSAGNIATYTNPEQITYQYTYGANGQVESIDIPGAGLVSFTDYQWNKPTRIQLPGGSVIQRQYDGLQRMASNSLKDPAQQSLMNVVYGYDSVGNITGQSTEHGEYSYGYDDLYRLAGADYPQAQNETFTYDGVGNRASYNGGDSWQYNDANQLTAESDTTYKYNTNGHMTQKTVGDETTYYIYDSQERLVRVENSEGNVMARYGFNPFGLRLWKEVGGVKTYFFYNQSGLVGEYTSAGDLIKEYQYAVKSPWMTNPLLQRDSGEVYFYQNDHLGTPQRMVAKSGAVVWQSSYMAFGKAPLFITKISNNLRFPGQYFDQETEFYHNYFRDYDPTLGRYIQFDPIGLKGGVNGYSYTYNNPINYSDPYGLNPLLFLAGCTAKDGAKKYEQDVASNEFNRDVFEWQKIRDKMMQQCGEDHCDQPVKNNECERAAEQWYKDKMKDSFSRFNERMEKIRNVYKKWDFVCSFPMKRIVPIRGVRLR
ncbi:RHS repeat-associated core domain-containing protein, partial [Marinobacter oulmenensis]